MRELSQIQQVEAFHLVFLRLLEHSAPKNCYSLKGGCNLRFFFKSIRYSEDMDLDIWELRVDQLKERVTKILDSAALHVQLRNLGFELENIRAPKQTDTTQRWKMMICGRGGAIPRPTKIEFSRRTAAQPEQVVFEGVDSNIIEHYALLPVMAQHYGAQAALSQKLDALLHRKETQARDIFDISLLLDKASTPATALVELGKKAALLEERILSIDFDAFHSQVVSYLEPGFQAYYDERRWETIQLGLLERLGGR